MEYEINPCEACWNKYRAGNCEINDLNSCLTETAAAFAAFPSNASLRDTPALDNWGACIVAKMSEIGRAPCNFQLHMAPVFVQVPHNFPARFNELIAKGNPLSGTQNPLSGTQETKDKALEQALIDCKTSTYPNQCVINCHTDYDAVILKNPRKDSRKDPRKDSRKDPRKDSRKRSSEGFEDNIKNLANTVKTNVNTTVKTTPISVVLWIILAFIALIFLVVLFK